MGESEQEKVWFLSTPKLSKSKSTSSEYIITLSHKQLIYFKQFIVLKKNLELY